MTESFLLNHTKTPGFLASRGEVNPEPETRLDRSELLCNKVLLKYKGDRESFWQKHQKGAREYPLASVSNEVKYSPMNPKNVWRLWRPQQTYSHNLHFKITALARRFNRETVLRQDTLLLHIPCFDLWITINCGKFWKRWEYQTTRPASWETYMQVRKQQLELDMEQQTGSN